MDFKFSRLIETLMECGAVCCILCLCSAVCAVQAADSAGASGAIPASPASPLITRSDGLDPCALDRYKVPLTMIDAVSRALCANPKTRGAWVTIRLNAASVKIAKEGYLPTLVGTAKELESDTATRLKDYPALDTNAKSHYPEGTLSLSWVLFDFGQRTDELESARELLAAAQANLDVALQDVFLLTAGDYYEAQAAQASLKATVDVEEITRKSVSAARFRVDKGIAPISDELQAKTALAMAVVQHVKAEADLKTKQGALATDMGLDPDQIVTLPQSELNVSTGADFADSLRDLIAEAKRNHPSVVVAERELRAAQADERAARAHGYPSLSLVGELSRSDEPLAPSLGSPSIPGNVSNKSIGLQLTIPFSDAFWKRGLIAKAHAQVEVQRETLNGTEQQVAQNVWKSYTELKAETDNLDNWQILLDSAQISFESTQHRYEGGAGNIVELLSSQAAYANAQQQRIQAVSDWRFARLALAASLGRLGLWAIKDEP
jgi:outer membrane protein